jgi:ABC-type oligopeptide transport system substrate-binding subunit
VHRRLGGSLATLVTGAALLVASSGVGASAAEEVPKGGTLRAWSPTDVDSVDPGLGYLRNAWLIADASCAKLFSYRSGQGGTATRIAPEVVRSFTRSRDGRIYTFTLRPSFRFHTGARVTAQSFAAAFDRNAQPRFLSPAKPYMREIVGAAAVIDGKATSISGIRVLDRYRLQIRLTKPLGDFTARLTMPFFCPILPNTPVDPRGIDNPAGSGPYFVAERVANLRIVLERNPFYGGGRPANVDRIVWTIGESLEACRLAVEEDRADFCGEPGAPRSAWRDLAERYGINRPAGQLFVGPSVQTWFYVFNHNRPAFRGSGQIPLKKAINYAIDRPALARTFGYLAGKRTDQLLPPALTRATSIYPLDGANPVAARRWYAKARFKPTRLVLYSWNFPPAVAQAQVLAFNLRQLGVDLEVKEFDLNTVFEKMRTPGEPFDIVLQGWGADYPDPGGFFVPLLGRDGPLGVIVDDARVERRIAAANRLTGDARRHAWEDLDVDLMRNDPPWAPFVHTQNRTLVSPSVGCFVHHPILGVEITALCKKR